MVAVTLLISASEPDSAAVASALERAILSNGDLSLGSALSAGSVRRGEVQVKTVEAAATALESSTSAEPHILCPLTLAVPEALSFPRKALYSTCRDVVGLRQRVSAAGYSVGGGNLWVPIVLTAKGPLYGEAIGKAGAAGQPGSGAFAAGEFQQPIHLSDAQRQPLYRLGRWLLSDLEAPPAVYLLQVACQGDRPTFDRLWPFPAAPALASQGRQSPDLFSCHWRCLTQQPIRDLQVKL